MSSVLGESPPPPPRVCFGRDELIKGIIDLVETLTPIALFGAGGIGKTSIALTVLHHDRIKQRFGDDRRFIRCDQFPPSRIHFLDRLSKVLGAGVNNPEGLVSLRSSLSSREMIIILDSAEHILDPQGTNAREFYAMVEELSRFNNICLCITTRISAIPPNCTILNIPTLPMEAAYSTFYRIYDNEERSNLVYDILEQLDFHPLSVTLLATVASQNGWDNNQLVREWEQRRTGVLQMTHNRSPVATIELSLASPMFQELSPDARGLLGVVAFFPQGIDEKNIGWLFPVKTNIDWPSPIKNTPHPLFPSHPKIMDTFDKFCALSLTYRSNGFVTMLAPLRDYLLPKDPKSSPLLCSTKESYFSRLSVNLDPGKPGFEEAKWIKLEDMNVEHLLDVFTSIDANSVGVWDACVHFMRHLYWHKRRLVTLRPKIEGLPDDHPSKPHCLFQLSRLYDSVGNRVERKRLLTRTLNLRRERGDDLQVARTLRFLADSNRLLGLRKEGAQQTKEGLEIHERLNDIPGQARCLQYLAWLLYDDEQLDAAEEAASRAIDLLPDAGEQFEVCRCHRVLGLICYSRGKVEAAINHFETALRISSPFDWHSEQFWIHHAMAELFSDESRFDDAHSHTQRAESHAIGDPYLLGRVTEQRAGLLHDESRFEEAKSEALRAADIYGKIGATKDVEDCKAILRSIEEKMKKPVTSGESDSMINGKFLETILVPTVANSPFLDRGTG